MKVFVGGVSGVGKTTFAGVMASRGFQAAKTSDLIFDRFGLLRGDYRALWSIASDAKDAAMEAIVNGLLDVAEQQRSDLVVDAHYLNFMETEVRRVVGPWIRRFDALILLETDPVEVSRRIRADGSRRDRYPHPGDGERTSSLEYIGTALTLTRSEAVALSERYGRPLLVIDNSGRPEVAVDTFLRRSAELGGIRG